MANILVVDDDPDFVEIVRTVLVKEGHVVTTASNGDQALKQARQKRPDVLLLDVMMSYVVEGLNVARQFRSDLTLQDVPILVISSLTGVQATDIFPAGEHATVDAWISKPVKPAMLLEKISALVTPQPS